ncbi:uncharacterized protein A1O5_06708 [Cladophialophora psammophila CBS 110553]|uniref:Major facilitator superfamily (MFS) profile domain-containing protein n=1 Tax=Cladophialophora psammophila CBS 110553 TaxID=1182543 RepID=W9WQZ8_9EURO|nr:uncharacterized protein A1O5_06708 [Cladophialophora psammophila CBS 110553]EXJ70637.1 hypothetical protein A1O5_06708 [Cladophialophora psammophila CBS 110553]
MDQPTSPASGASVRAGIYSAEAHRHAAGELEHKLGPDSKEVEVCLEHLEDGEKSSRLAEYLQLGLGEDDALFLASISPAKERSIYRKVDYRVVPMLSFLYLISHLDRANIGNAKIEGLEDSLGMQGDDYNIAVALFFIPYILCEVPSNMILAKFKRPSYYIGILVTCWGTIVTLSGIVQSFAGLCITRFLIGIFEAGFFPGAVWLISQWYPPNKTQSRNALFYVSSAASGAFSGLLAAGIAQMDGLGGLRGWRWIFIIEGILSVCFGVVSFFLLPDSPTLSGRWLNADEQRYLHLMHFVTRGVNKPEVESSESTKRFRWKYFRQLIGDPHIYLQAMICASNTVPNNGLKFTMPTIIKNMGFRSTNAQLLSAPPYFAGAIAAVLSSLWADKHARRMPIIVFFQALVVISMSVLFSFAPKITSNVALCYTMVVLACVGVYPIVPACNAWTVNNLAGAEKRVMGIAFMVTMGNTGGFIGSWIFKQSEAPRYPTGFGTSLAFGAAGIVCALLLEFLYARHNKKWAAVSKEDIMARYSVEELGQMGDKSPLFKYSL